MAACESGCQVIKHEKEYVLGFAFHQSRVLMIRKERPEFMKGKSNGIGGKIEPGETPLAAMIRECREEAGLDGIPWQQCLMFYTGDGALVHVFRAFTKKIWDYQQGLTDEEILIQDVEVWNGNWLSNLHWMVRLLYDQTVIFKHNEPMVIHQSERSN